MTTPNVQPIPEGFHTITPHLICADALRAMDFCKKAFNAIELNCLLTPDGKLMHGCMQIGDSPIMFCEECAEYRVQGPKALQGSPVYIHLYVPDVDAAIAQAESAGAKVIMPATDMFWGDRYGQIEDPFGHLWSIASRKQILTHTEIQQASANCLPPK